MGSFTAKCEGCGEEFRSTGDYYCFLCEPSLPKAKSKNDIIKELEAKLKIAEEALGYVKSRTEQCPEKGMHPHGFIRSTRMRKIVCDALVKIRGEKDENT